MKNRISLHPYLKLISVVVTTLLVACGGVNPKPESVVSMTVSPTSVSSKSGKTTLTPVNLPPQGLVESVTFTTTDGISLVGTMFGAGNKAVILAHQGTTSANQINWQPFARLLAERGFTALTFNFRGVGLSEGELSHQDVAIDVSAAVEFLHERGYEKIACVGASMGGTACIRVAQDYPFTGLIILASAMRTGVSDADSLNLSPVDLESLTPPKLFIYANHESSLVINDTRRMYKLSPEPKALLSFPGTRHGTDLFSTDIGGELNATMLRFIENMDNLASETLPALQPITTENAGKVQLLRTMAIPSFQRGRLSQCSLAFSPDGSMLVGACGKNRVPIWDVQNGFLLRTLYDSPEQIVTCAFSPDGNQIACGGFDKTITLWDALTGRKIQSVEGHMAPIWELAFNPTGKSLASCSLGLLGDGTGRGDIRLWDMPNSEPIWSYPGTRDYLSVSFDPSGEKIAYGSIGGSVGILDAASGELIRELTDSTRNIGDVSYSPSGRWLAAGSDDNRIYLWDTSNFELINQLTGHAGFVNGVAFNPEETLLVSGSHDKTVGIWNLVEQKPITLLKGHKSEVLRVAFSPDRMLIASISWDGTVRLWGVSNE